MKKLILCAVLFSASVSANAQGYKETFDSNSLEWTECAYKNGIGTAIIDKGVMTIKSKGEKKRSICCVKRHNRYGCKSRRKYLF